MNIPAGMGVIPRAEIPPGQPDSCDIFRREDQDGIDQPAQPELLMFQQPSQRPKEKSHSVDGEHPQRGLSSQFSIEVFICKAGERRDQDFPTPANTAAEQEVFHERQQYMKYTKFVKSMNHILFPHTFNMSKSRSIYSCHDSRYYKNCIE